MDNIANEAPKEWVILALKHQNSGGRNDGAPFYGPNYGGYRMTLTEAGLYTEEVAKREVAGCDKGELVAYHFADPVLRTYLKAWGQIRLVEFDLYHQLRHLNDLRIIAAGMRRNANYALDLWEGEELLESEEDQAEVKKLLQEISDTTWPISIRLTMEGSQDNG